MPALLAQASAQDIQVLKEFAYHAGLIFQIKDDLLDDEGDPKKLGKDTHMDTENHSSFVIVLGSQHGAGVNVAALFPSPRRLKPFILQCTYA